MKNFGQKLIKRNQQKGDLMSEKEKKVVKYTKYQQGDVVMYKLNDEDFVVRTQIEMWMASMNTHEGNRRTFSAGMGSDGGTGLASGDFDAISGWSAGSSLAGSATTYGSNVFKPPSDTWSTSGYNDFTATSDLLTDMQNDNVVIICFRNYVNDYLNSALTVNAFLDTGGYYANYTGTSRDPKIDYTLAATGYGDTVNGVAPANISKVNDVATANIEKVIGVD